MAIRKIIQIDEEKCNGCGECIPDCREGALQILEGKAKLIRESYCDGLGACIGSCPQGAITVVERDVEDFDAEAAAAFQAAGDPSPHAQAAHGAACPGAALMDMCVDDRDHAGPEEEQETHLRQWPVQLRLVPVKAPFFDGADLLLAADCVPFAMPDFHERLLHGKKLLVGCPKLDDSAYYAEKLTAILEQNDVRSLTVAHVEVPCCYGLVALARRALASSGKQIPLKEVTVSVRGAVKETSVLSTAQGGIA